MSREAAASSNSVVELRVHGVSGTPPEEILKCPTELLERVAGDNAAGFSGADRAAMDSLRKRSQPSPTVIQSRLRKRRTRGVD